MKILVPLLGEVELTELKDRLCVVDELESTNVPVSILLKGGRLDVVIGTEVSNVVVIEFNVVEVVSGSVIGKETNVDNDVVLNIVVVVSEEEVVGEVVVC